MFADACALRLNGRRAIALRALIGITGDGADSRTGWVHLAYEGEWNGHPEGPLQLTREDFAACIAAFNAQQNPIRLDYEHASLRVPDGQPTPSAGFVQKLELRDSGLWALVEFTRRCAQMIRDGEARFCSAVFMWDSPDRKSGEPRRCELHSIAMTDTPFIDGQQPIALSRRSSHKRNHAMKVKREALMELLDKIEGDEIEAEQLHAAVEAAAAAAVAIDGAKEDDIAAKDKPEDEGMPETAATGSTVLEAPAPMAEPSDPATDPAALAARLQELATKAGTDVASLLLRLEEMIAAPADNPAALKNEVATAKAEVAALKSSVAALGVSLKRYQDAERETNEKARKAEIAALDAEVDAMVKSGRVLSVDAEKWRVLAHRDATSFRTLAATIPAAVPTGKEAAARPTPPPGESAIDETHPDMVALSQQLDRFGVKDEKARATAKRNHWNRITGAAG